MLEIWATIGTGVLLAVAGVAQGLALFKIGPSPRGWGLVAAGARLGSALALTAALILAVVAHGEWSPSDLRQVTLGLALATLVIYLILAWRPGMGSASPVVDMVILALVLVDLIAVRPGGCPLTSAQRTVPFQVQWALFLLGSGGVVVAGSAGLMRVFQAPLTRRGGDLGDVHTVLRQSTSLALVALGSGIVVSIWWSWQTVGFLTSGDPRIGWIAITWLVAAMSELAWQLDRRLPVSDHKDHEGRWAAGLAIVAAAVAIFGLLALEDLLHLLGANRVSPWL